MGKEVIKNNNTAILKSHGILQPATRILGALKQKPWLVTGLMVLNLLLVGIIGFLFNQNYHLKQQILQTPSPSFPEATKTPETPNPLPTIRPHNDLTPTTIPTKEISYSLPSGWETIKDTNNQFEIGFNPNELNASSYPARIRLNRKQCCFSFDIRIESYDGGARHSLLNQNFQGYETNSNTFEKNYLINGKSGLVIYNVEYSSTTVIGMINIDRTKAFVFNSTGGNEQQIEQILSTIKLLQ